MPQSARILRIGSASRDAPQFGHEQSGREDGDEEQHVEEEIDECVHAREQTTGGRTSAGGGWKILRMKLEFEPE